MSNNDDNALDAGLQAPIKVSLAWEQVIKDSYDLGSMMSQFWPEPAGIMAIARGGLIPATLIAHKYGIRRVLSCTLESYKDGSTHADTIVCRAWPVPFGNDINWYAWLSESENRASGWWVIDDIYDTGLTFDWIHKKMPGALHACLYSKNPQPDTIPSPIFVRAYPPNAWISLPWERDNEITFPGVDMNKPVKGKIYD